jgi:hypothetical protein
MSLLTVLSGLVRPVADLIDNVHTSEEEKLAIKAKLFEMQTGMAAKVLEYEGQLLKAKTAIITAEANGQSWLQRNWRPITMLTFLILVVLDTMGYTEFRLSVEAWALLKIGIGGYVVGRTVEKVAPRITEVLAKK